MTEIIDFTDNKDKKERKEREPESSCLMHCDDGTYYKFSIDYAFQNKTWSFEMWAKSEEEANKRLHAIQHLPVEVKQIYAEQNNDN